MSLKRYVKLTLTLLASAMALSTLSASPSRDANLDGVDRSDPRFVTASLLVMGPGEELFACVGHAAIRLECPTFQLDYCFSYESEDAAHRVLAFLAGNLKMGMFAIPTTDFLKSYVQEGREVRQYQLNLTPAVKQRLWKIMDDLAAQGAQLPYDYIDRGCAKSVLDCLVKACAPDVLRGPILPITQRETFNRELSQSHPWNLFILNAIVGTETDTFVEVVTPQNLLNYLRRATVNGMPILSDAGREIVPPRTTVKSSFVTPKIVAVFIFLIAIVCVIGWWRHLLWAKIGLIALLVIQALAGCFFVFLVTASHLPNSSWNWLLVPFNPFMPVIALCVVLRRDSSRGDVLVFALTGSGVLLIVWSVAMLLLTHARTDVGYIVLAKAYALIYGAMAWALVLSRRDKVSSQNNFCTL